MSEGKEKKWAEDQLKRIEDAVDMATRYLELRSPFDGDQEMKQFVEISRAVRDLVDACQTLRQELDVAGVLDALKGKVHTAGGGEYSGGN